MAKHQSCAGCGKMFVGPDLNIGSNFCNQCQADTHADCENQMNELEDKIVVERRLNAALRQENEMLKKALAKTRVMWEKIFKQYKSRQHDICNQAMKIIDQALTERP